MCKWFFIDLNIIYIVIIYLLSYIYTRYVIIYVLMTLIYIMMVLYSFTIINYYTIHDEDCMYICLKLKYKIY